MSDTEIESGSPAPENPEPSTSRLRNFHSSVSQLRRIWPLIALAVVSLALIFASDAPVIYPLALALGALGVAIGIRLPTASPNPASPLERFSARTRDIPTILRVGGVALNLLLIVRVLTGPTTGYDLLLWTAGIVIFAASFIDLKNVKNIRLPRFPHTDIAIVAAIFLLCIFIYAHDLRDWYYAFIGDEYAFFHRIQQIIGEGIRDPFSLRGAYHNTPTLNIIYQAFTTWIFGGGAWGWKFASVFSVALAVPAVYWLGHIFGGRVAATVSAAVFASSHYLMAITHTGYAHSDVMSVTAWALLTFIIGIRRNDPLTLFAAGFLAGLGLYVFLPARVILPLFVVWLVVNRTPFRRLPDLWPVAFGFALTALPFVAFNGFEALSVMGLDLVASPNTIFREEVGDPVSRIISNLSRNLLAFWWNPTASHYTSGSLLDIVSGSLAILGIGVAVGKWRRTDKMLIVWFLITLFATAALSPHDRVPITRMYVNLLPLALICGVGLSVSMDWIKDHETRKLIALAAILTLILFLNIWRFQVETPTRIYHYSLESLAIKAWHSEECARSDDTLFIGSDTHPMDIVLAAYVSQVDPPAIALYDDPIVFEPRDACKIFYRPQHEEAQRIIESLAQPTIVFANPTGASYVEVIR